MKLVVMSGMLVALLATASWSCSPEEGSAEPATNETIVAVAVETTVLSSSDFVETVEVSGVAQPISEIKVAAEAAGRVTSAPIQEGKRVEKGDLVLRVDAQLDSARLDVLQSQLGNARREYERTKMLAREGLATPQQLDQAAAAVDSSSLNIKQARVGMGKSTVRSPFTGLVAEKYVEEGEYVGPGTPLAHIVDYETIVIETSVPEGDIAYVRVGDRVEIWLPALDKSYDGVVQRRAVLADGKTRTYPVEIHIPNTALEILPGMRARVIIPRKSWRNVVVVPRDAILQGYESKEAMVFPGPGKEGEAELRKVELGPARGNRIVVTQGLDAGDRLIVKGHRGIVGGTKVKVVRETQGQSETQAPAPTNTGVSSGQTNVETRAKGGERADSRGSESATN